LESIEQAAKVSIVFWDEAGKHIQEWKLAKEGKVTAGEIRRDFVHCHAILLQALGVMGNALFDLPKAERQEKLALLKKIDWRRSNSKAWEGRAMSGGHMQKSGNNVALTAAYLKKRLRLKLSPEEKQIEAALKRGNHG
jgi:DNA sulfur modification protein DndB